jgi:predicted nucleotidyltransferase
MSKNLVDETTKRYLYLPIDRYIMTFSSFSGIKILTWFLANPTQKIHFKDLCRELQLAPSTIKTYCEEFLKKDWLGEERTANLRIFYLKNENYVVRSLKRTYFLGLMQERKIEILVDTNVISFALYGSHASGDYDELSDIDLFVIGKKEQVHYNLTKKLEKKFGKQIQATVLSLGKWEQNKHSDPFLRSVLKNHVLLKGAAL